MSYSVEPRNKIFVKGYGFLCFVKNMSKNTGSKISKKVNKARNVLIILNNLPEMHLKLFQKEQCKKQLKQLVV